LIMDFFGNLITKVYLYYVKLAIQEYITAKQIVAARVGENLILYY